MTWLIFVWANSGSLGAAGFAIEELYLPFDSPNHPLNPRCHNYEDYLAKALQIIDTDAEAGRRFGEDVDKEHPSGQKAWFIKDVLATCDKEKRTLVRWWGYADGAASWEPTEWIKEADLIWAIWEATPKLNMERSGDFQQEHIGVGQNLGVKGNNKSIGMLLLRMPPSSSVCHPSAIYLTAFISIVLTPLFQLNMVVSTRCLGRPRPPHCQPCRPSPAVMR